MNANKALWNSVCVTDPAAVKPITGKQYRGNSPKPYWIVERLTDTFGPCGLGWGFSVVNERFERFGEGASAESLHIALISFWYVHTGPLGQAQRGELQQIGQTKAAYTTSSGKFLLDEDAPKKSVTDALVKCASYLGFAGDIFSGRWDDSKYVQAAAEHWDGVRREAHTPSEEEIAAALAAVASAGTPRQLKEAVAAASAKFGADSDALGRVIQAANDKRNAALAAKQGAAA